jgi:hypothetical protein
MNLLCCLNWWKSLIYIYIEIYIYLCYIYSCIVTECLFSVDRCPILQVPSFILLRFCFKSNSYANQHVSLAVEDKFFTYRSCGVACSLLVHNWGLCMYSATSIHHSHVHCFHTSVVRFLWYLYIAHINNFPAFIVYLLWSLQKQWIKVSL